MIAPARIEFLDKEPIRCGGELVKVFDEPRPADKPPRFAHGMPKPPVRCGRRGFAARWPDEYQGVTTPDWQPIGGYADWIGTFYGTLLRGGSHRPRRDEPHNATGSTPMADSVSTEDVDLRVATVTERYRERLELPRERLRITTNQPTFERWLGRRLSSSVGGAYAYLPRRDEHVVLINLTRIDLRQANALDIVVAEELIHMRDRLDGDLRRHAKHGHDRIAYRVAALTGASLDEVRGCLHPPRRRPYRYLYACPGCGATIRRRRTGTWSCGHCAPRFDHRFVLQLKHVFDAEQGNQVDE